MLIFYIGMSFFWNRPLASINPKNLDWLKYVLWILVATSTSLIGPFGFYGALASPIFVVLAIVLLLRSRSRWYGLIGLIAWIPSFCFLVAVMFFLSGGLWEFGHGITDEFRKSGFDF